MIHYGISFSLVYLSIHKKCLINWAGVYYPVSMVSICYVDDNGYLSFIILKNITFVLYNHLSIHYLHLKLKESPSSDEIFFQISTAKSSATCVPHHSFFAQDRVHCYYRKYISVLITKLHILSPLS